VAASLCIFFQLDETCDPGAHYAERRINDVVKNWKTTLLGLAAAFLNLLANGATPKSAAMSVALAALGAVAADHSQNEKAKE
jgi:hypothetical protein